MDCLENEKEFYELIGKKIYEITFSNISEDEKDSLYQLVDKNIQEYEIGEANMEKNSRFTRAYGEIAKGLQKVIPVTIPITNQLPNLKKTCEVSREKVPLLNESKEIVNKMLPKAKYTEERLRMEKLLRDYDQDSPVHQIK